ncbi:HNH endonuclease [Thermobifida halotolerans]|uniref:HNH endonuclease n=1 Tax=Thermobifida halotolerans TaxID=483545 RepID=A0AA97M4R6_9ACTN|nr:HNH endonuclease [Thermobifida halotolerans]
MAHIVPWAKVREHTFENMIVLCPNCHTRFDRGEIDRLSMLEYKAQLKRISRTGADEKTRSERVRILETHGAFQTVIEIWWREIYSVSLAYLDLEETQSTIEETRSTYVEEFRHRAEEARALLEDFTRSGSTDMARAAEEVIDAMQQWADAAIEGIWPSSHIDAYTYYEDDVDRPLSSLQSCVYEYLGIGREDFSPSIQQGRD